MKGLWLHLPPFAPDTSGAASVLAPLSLTVFVDAGGCAGNFCGFDEPRFASRPLSVASAALRDMDAILGRDERLLDRLALAADALMPQLVALVGTPIPAVIGTDMRSLVRLGERRLGVPMVAVNTSGTRLYDFGIEAALLALLKKFAREMPRREGTLGVLGVTPLDFSPEEAARLRAALTARGWRVSFIGESLRSLREAASLEKILAVTASAVRPARYLKEKFGVPYEVTLPEEALLLPPLNALAGGERVLILHEAVRARAIASSLAKRFPAAEFKCATFFKRLGDDTLHLEGEDELAAAARGFDVVMGDALYRRALTGFEGTFIPLPHFAVSGSR